MIEEFEEEIKDQSKFNTLGNYVISIFFLLMAMYCGYKAFSFGFRPKFGILLNCVTFFMPLMFLIIGLYGFWKIPTDNKVKTVLSDLSLQQKEKVITNYLEMLNVLTKQIVNCNCKINYKVNPFYGNLNLTIYFDEKQFLVNVKNADLGFTDFGLTKKATNKIITYLTTNSLIL